MKSSVKSEKGSTIICAEIEINKPKDQVWAVLKTIADIQNFHPLIKKSSSITNLKNGKGAQRSCELLPMGQMIEEVIEWNEGSSFTMKVIGGKALPPYHFMKGRIELFEIDDRTKVQFTFSYQLKFGALGNIMNALVIRPQFKKAPPQYVAGLKQYVEGLNH